MTGDVVDVFGKSFWHSNGVNPTNNYLITSALSTFINAFAGTSAVAGSGHGATASALNGSSATTSGLNGWLGGVPNPTQVNVPKAYINWILFDEQFKPVASNSSFDLISTTADAVKNHHSTVNISKSGYLYVYCSNESNIDVFFDNLQLIHTRGPLLETSHYYPFGLTMAGISSQAAGKLENLRKYNKGSELQHKEFSDGGGLELYATNFRSLDSQLGRWWQIDPKPDMAMSLYSSMGNNPILFNDPLGDTIIVDKRGYVVKQYGKDNLVFLQKGKKLRQIGELGKVINANKIFKNLLNRNIKEAQNSSNPFTFRDLVKNKGEWDLKNNQKTIYGLANNFDKGKENKTEFSFQGSNYTAADLGNYHYGATGKAFGFFLFTEEVLLRSAGSAQMAAGTSKPEWQKYETRYENAGHGEQRAVRGAMIPPYGDDPDDQNMIKQGFNYYNTNKENLNEED